MWRTSKPRAFSIVELLVASSILLVLLGSLYLLMTAGMRYYMQARQYRSAQAEAMAALRAMAEDMQDSNAGSATFSNSFPQPHLILISAQRPFPNASGPLQNDPNGQILWQKWVAYVLDSPAANTPSNLVRSELVQAPLPTTVVPAPPAASAFALTGPGTRIIARNIVDLDFTPTASSMTVTVVAREAVGSNRFTAITLKSTILLQN